MDTLSMPAAPLLRLTAFQDSCMSSGVILPVKEWILRFFGCIVTRFSLMLVNLYMLEDSSQSTLSTCLSL